MESLTEQEKLEWESSIEKQAEMMASDENMLSTLEELIEKFNKVKETNTISNKEGTKEISEFKLIIEKFINQMGNKFGFKIKDIIFENSTSGSDGGYDLKTHKFYLNLNLEVGEALATIIHEMRHAMQDQCFVYGYKLYQKLIINNLKNYTHLVEEIVNFDDFRYHANYSEQDAEKFAYTVLKKMLQKFPKYDNILSSVKEEENRHFNMVESSQKAIKYYSDTIKDYIEIKIEMCMMIFNDNFDTQEQKENAIKQFIPKINLIYKKINSIREEDKNKKQIYKYVAASILKNIFDQVPYEQLIFHLNNPLMEKTGLKQIFNNLKNEKEFILHLDNPLIYNPNPKQIDELTLNRYKNIFSSLSKNRYKNIFSSLSKGKEQGN